MSNLLTVLPNFDIAPFTHILPSLERALISTADLIALDAFDVAKRAQVPPGEVKKLADAAVQALHHDAASSTFSSRDDSAGGDTWDGFQTGTTLANRWTTISTLDDTLDVALGGGIARGHLTEIVGER